jgi:hypothetical protein
MAPGGALKAPVSLSDVLLRQLEFPMSPAENVLTELLSYCPNFAAEWDRERDLWTSDDGSFTVHSVFTVFSHYIAGRLIRGEDPALVKVFHLIESKLTGDDSEVENAACTCFLENLMNRVPEAIPAQTLIPLLGPEARRFCRSWDEVCGVKTEGLW